MPASRRSVYLSTMCPSDGFPGGGPASASRKGVTGRLLLETEFAQVEDLAESGAVIGFPGGPWGPSGFIVDCPIIALR